MVLLCNIHGTFLFNIIYIDIRNHNILAYLGNIHYKYVHYIRFWVTLGICIITTRGIYIIYTLYTYNTIHNTSSKRWIMRSLQASLATAMTAQSIRSDILHVSFSENYALFKWMPGSNSYGTPCFDAPTMNAPPIVVFQYKIFDRISTSVEVSSGCPHAFCSLLPLSLLFLSHCDILFMFQICHDVTSILIW